jgi:hypothetical protein
MINFIQNFICFGSKLTILIKYGLLMAKSC